MLSLSNPPQGAALALHKAVLLFQKFGHLVIHVLQPYGIWGLGALAFIDSGLFPLPTTMDGAVFGYVQTDHHKLVLYCLMAAAASALGSMIPYYVGRAGGELFLLKRINRERYEKMRDKFENQEFMAIMFPAMMPPPMPIKVFEFAAGVFEMRPLVFMLAIFVGKCIQFTVGSVVLVIFGAQIFRAVRDVVHEHFSVAMAVVAAIVLALLFYVLRKLFDRKRAVTFPLEGDDNGTEDIAESDDSTLIT